MARLFLTPRACFGWQLRTCPLISPPVIRHLRPAALACLLASAFPCIAADRAAERAAEREREAKEEVMANAMANSLTDAEKAAGWKLLFDGKSAQGLRPMRNPNAGWKVEGGTLSLPKDIKQSGKVTGGDLATIEQFTDFEFAFQWKLSVSSNTGVLYLARGSIGQKPTGCEYQIIDDVHHPDGLKGGPLRRTGALYTIIPPAEDKLVNEAGKWNSGKIVVLGNHVEHWLNGAKVLEYDLGSQALQKTIAANKVKVPMGFGTKIKSSIVILDEGEEVAWRGLKVRVLAPPAAPAPQTSAPKALQ